MSEETFVHPDFAQAIAAAGLDSVEGAFAYSGGDDLDKPGLGDRRRTRITLADPQGRPMTAFLKRYGGEPLLTRLNGQSRARMERDAIEAVTAAGVATMKTLAFGQETKTGRSYIVVSCVPGEALERCGEAFWNKYSAGREAAIFTERLADFVRTLHASELVHRDLYASHIFADDTAKGPRFYLIDLARVFNPWAFRLRRWKIKDLAALKFSLPPRWVRACWVEFLRQYLRNVSPDEAAKYPAAIDRRVACMRQRCERKKGCVPE